MSIKHTRWNYKNYTFFIPEYRCKAMYGEYRADMGKILRQICEMEYVELIEGRVCIDHVHMYVSVPLRVAISDFAGRLNGKSALMFFDMYPVLMEKSSRHFWTRGYFVDTDCEVNDATIREYIRTQEECDKNE